MNSTKLTVTKSVVERVKKLLDRKKIDLSITQFVEHILVESCDAIESEEMIPAALPTVAWIRQKLGKGDTNALLRRIADIEQRLSTPLQPTMLKKHSA